MSPYWDVPYLWPHSTVVCIAGGPSLVPEDVRYCRGRVPIIVVNNAYLLAPWADVLFAIGTYGPGPSWWELYPDAVLFPGLKVTMDTTAAVRNGIHLVRRGAVTGLSTERNTLNHGYNSGYAAINLAIHLGAARVVLLGYDMQPGEDSRDHWHPDHAHALPPPYVDWQLAYETLPAALAAQHVQVINASRATALTCFPSQPLPEALRATV